MRALKIAKGKKHGDERETATTADKLVSNADFENAIGNRESYQRLFLMATTLAKRSLVIAVALMELVFFCSSPSP